MVKFTIKGIKKACNNYGKAYYYDRVSGQRIKAPFGTAEFMEELEILRADPSKPIPQKGSLGRLIHAYKLSPEFTRLADRTRSDYQKIFDFLQKLDDLPISNFTPPRCIAIRNKAFKKHKRRFANYVTSVLSLVFNWGIPNGYCTINPCGKIKPIRPSREEQQRPANRPWSASELNAVLDNAEPHIKLAVALGAFTSFREGDVMRLPWSAYDGTIIAWTHTKNNAPVFIPVHSRLKEILDTAEVKSPIMVIGKRGKPYTESGFRAVFFRMIRKLTDQGKIEPGLTFHGLRHSIATALAEEGADNRTIMAITGHKNDASVARYTQTADNKRLAKIAINKLEKRK